MPALLAESLLHDHERDGRSWKLEWHAVPELTMAAGKALNLLARLLESARGAQPSACAPIWKRLAASASEAIMLALARQSASRPPIGGASAPAKQAAESGQPFCRIDCGRCRTFRVHLAREGARTICSHSVPSNRPMRRAGRSRAGKRGDARVTLDWQPRTGEPARCPAQCRFHAASAGCRLCGCTWRPGTVDQAG